MAEEPPPASSNPPSPGDRGHRGLLGPAAGSHILSKEAGRFRCKSWVYSCGVGRGAVFHFLLGGWGGNWYVFAVAINTFICVW